MEPKEKLDQWLDQALSEYGNVAPRQGLENRILTNLQMAQDRRFQQRWWAWAAIPIAAAAIAVIWLSSTSILRRSVPDQGATRATSSNTVVPPPNRTIAHRDAPAPVPANARTVSAHKRASRPLSANARSLPKPEQFPSPRPLSEQEELLAAYVSTTPVKEVVNPAKTAKDLGRLQISNLQVGGLETPALDSELRWAEPKARN